MRFFFYLILIVISSLLLVGLAAQEARKPKNDKKKLLEFIQSNVDKIMEAVAKIRGKRYREKVPVGTKSPDEVEEFVLKAFEEELRPGELEEMKEVLVKFGLIKPELDLKSAITKMMKQGVAGLYIPKEKRLYIMEHIVRNAEKSPLAAMGFKNVLAHELTHALQDQHFNIDAFMRHIYDNDDKVMAAQAVVEGEATLIGTEYMFNQMGTSVLKFPIRIGDQMKMQFGKQQEALKDIPKVLLKVLVFPYIYGSNFVQDFVKKYDFNRIDTLFERPPISTEQILHPEKYLSDETDYPTDIRYSTLEKVLGEDEWKLLDSSCCGEYIIRLIGEHFIDEADAETMSEGWDGDRYNVLREKKSGRTVLVWFSTWDSEKDAEEFFNFYIEVLQKKYDKKFTKTEETAFFYTDSNHLVWIERSNNDVLVAETVSRDELKKIREHMKSAKKVVVSDEPVELKERELKFPEPKKRLREPKPEEQPEEF